MNHPLIRTAIDLLLAALVVGGIAAIDFLQEKLPGQPGLLDTSEGWLVLFGPMIAAALSAARRWLTDWQTRKPITEDDMLERLALRLNPPTAVAPDAIGAAARDEEDVSPEEFGVDHEWRVTRRAAKAERRRLRNATTEQRYAAMGVIIWPFANMVILWIINNVGDLAIEWFEKWRERLRQRFPQHFPPVPPPHLVRPLKRDPANYPEDDARADATVPPAPTYAMPPEGEPDSTAKRGQWAHPPLNGFSGIHD